MAPKSNSHRPSNFVVFTLGIVGDGGKLSDQPTATGRAYSTARGFLLTGHKDQPSPFFDLKAFAKDKNPSALVKLLADLKPKSRVTVKGRLGYRKYESNGATREKLEIVVSSIAPVAQDESPSDFVMLTLKAIKDGGSMDFTPTGKARGKVSAMLSTGRDASGQYKPPLFLDIAHVSKDDQPNAVIEALSGLQKGAFFTVKGAFKMDEWDGADGATHHSFSIWANSLEPFHWEGTSELQDEPELEGEPA
jgi:single-stranded DNA-binding protein